MAGVLQMKELISWWNHIPEHINPLAFRIGVLQVHYYGLMYLAAFLTVYLLVMHRLKREEIGIKKASVDAYFLWVVIAVLAGGRLGYVLFYNLSFYLKHPLEVILPFDISNGFQYTGFYGMSYHGALIAVVIATVVFCRKHKLDFWRFADLFASVVPLGYTFGRLGNFINGELYGRITTVPWGMYFPLDSTHQLRHPSQLYEALLEGVFLFIIFWSLRKKLRVPVVIFFLYLIGYGAMRFFLEFFRQPDPQLGFVFGPLTMGQLLCFVMILTGAVIFSIRMLKLKRKDHIAKFF